jgi:hypothetical protein
MKNSSSLLAKALRGAGLALVLGFTTTIQAGLLDTQNNPVSFAGGNDWVNPTMWDAMGIPKFPLDTAADGTLNRDVSYISIVHDASFYYVRIHAAQGPTFGGDYNLWLDIDNNPATGQRHWTGNAAIGAERLVTGAALIQNIPAWTIAWLNWDQSSWDSGDVERDVFFSINRETQMPGVKSFDFTYQFYSSPNSATGDWYPDAADSQVGDFFRYTAGTPLTINFSSRTWTAIEQQTPLPTMGGQYDPIQTNSYSTPDANTGLINGRFGIDSSMTTPVTISLGDTVEYDFFITSETRNLSGNNADTWFGNTGTGFQDAAGKWVTGRNVRFNDSRNEDYFVSATGAVEQYVNQTRSATQATHVKWEFTSLNTATVTLTLAGEVTPYLVFTNVFGNIGDIAQFHVGLYDSEQDVTVANFTITPAGTPPPATLFFSGRVWTPLVSEASGQYSPPQTNHYAGVNANAGIMTGRFGVDSALTTPLTLAVGDKVTYDYVLTEESRNFRGTGASTWVGDSRTGFQDGADAWVSGRIATYNDRWTQFFEGNNPTSAYYARGYPWSIHAEWTFTSATTATVTLTLGGEVTPFAVWTDTFSDIANIAKFRVGLWDSEQDVTLANFTVLHPDPIRPAIITAASPVSYWRLAEFSGSTATDQIGGHNGTYAGTLAYGVTGAFPTDANSAVEFDGASGLVNVPYTAALNPQGPFTIEAWVRPNTVPDSAGTPCPISSAQFSGDRSGWQIRERDTGWQFVLYSHSGSTVANPDLANTAVGGTPATNSWTHLVGVYDGTTTYLYINGVAYSASASGYVANYNDGVNSAGPFTIGARSSLDNYFNGRVDEVAFYDRALTPTEVQSHFLNRPQLSISAAGGNVTLMWPVGTLQAADDVNGTYTDVLPAASPYSVAPSAARKFYRLKL